MQRSPPQPASGAIDLLTFRLDGDRYAISVEQVRRLLHAVAVTRLPGAPPVVEGVVSVHGEITPVFNLRRRFGLADREMAPEDHLVLAEADGRMALLHVDEVEAVTAIDRAAVLDPEQVMRGSTPLSGVARLADGLVFIHDLTRFLTEAESEQLDEALSAARPEDAP